MFGLYIFLTHFNIYKDAIVDSLQFVVNLSQRRQRFNIHVKYIKQKIITIFNTICINVFIKYMYMYSQFTNYFKFIIHSQLQFFSFWSVINN